MVVRNSFKIRGGLKQLIIEPLHEISNNARSDQNLC